MPSTSEGFGLPAVEALRCGRRPVYWRGCASVAEIAQDDGIMVASEHDAGQWADAMDRAVAAARTPVRPTARWRSRYEWDNVAHRVADELMRSGAVSGARR